ncbi:hypothetical protein LF599_11480 [Pseudodesulfovibrio thermohalotolerans]|uniref:hypothetical protein n=1 Tax=Pseudodesulfovibrio thermohalotolerans TaxID=2880651 RepID=UPI0022BA0156|nr:hypothetical protein [Pseudodesulfovibrio thermohalotolerans]WFS61294.1 hypothetical protein LF599_11480 [Pseudodesulfovibrio thermohalotolerans]
MQTLLGLLVFIVFLALILGLIKPKLVKMASRGKVAVVLGATLVVLITALGATAPDEPSSYSAPTNVEQTEKPLAKGTGHEWNKATDDKRMTACVDFVAVLHNRIDKPLATELKQCLDETFAGDVQNVGVAEAAAMCMSLMGELPK